MIIRKVLATSEAVAFCHDVSVPLSIPMKAACSIIVPPTPTMNIHGPAIANTLWISGLNATCMMSNTADTRLRNRRDRSSGMYDGDMGFPGAYGAWK